MRVTVSLEHRFQRTPDGRVWTNAGFDTRFWESYLRVFDEVRVAARVLMVGEPEGRVSPADGPGITFAQIPHYLGPSQFLLRLPAIARVAREIAAAGDAFILRVPSPIAGLVLPVLARRRHPYALEVIGDPYDVFSPGAVKHPLRAFFRMQGTSALRRQCCSAIAASYVTEHTLQARYPTHGRSFAISTIRLEPEAFVPASRTFARLRRIVFVGSLEQLYKAPDVLLESVARLAAEGLDLELVIIGDGRHRAELERSPTAAQLEGRVSFRGHLPPGEAIRNELDRADLFVLPSRTEGLPRAIIEAMARGLPCIGSTAGGIPELLAPEALVRPGDPGDLAARIREFAGNTDYLRATSARNLDVARGYSSQVLGPRRVEFYDFVRCETARAAAGA